MNARVLYETGVTQGELTAVEYGLRAVGLQIPQLGGLSVSSSRIQYETLSVLPSGQVDASVIDSLPSWTGQTANVVLTSRDLGHEGLNFIFGMSKYGQGNAILSSARLAQEELLALAVHELGHAFFLVTETSRQYDRVSAFAGHCTNPCVMQPVNNIDDMQLAYEKVLAAPAAAGFCDDCRSDLSRLHFA